MNFWFDRTVPFRLANLLITYDTENGLNHPCNESWITAQTTDAEILGRISPGSIIVAMESEAGKHRSLVAALNLPGLRYVVLTPKWSAHSFHEQAWHLLRLWPSIVRVMSETTETSIYVSMITPVALESMHLPEADATPKSHVMRRLEAHATPTRPDGEEIEARAAKLIAEIKEDLLKPKSQPPPSGAPRAPKAIQEDD